MDSATAAEEMLGKISDIDDNIKDAIKDEGTKSYVISSLIKGFDGIFDYSPNLVQDIQNRIVRYHSTIGSDGKITDFVQLVAWYGMYLTDKPVEYWDTNGKYYNLRMNEIINMFLMARFNS